MRGCLDIIIPASHPTVDRYFFVLFIETTELYCSIRFFKFYCRGTSLFCDAGLQGSHILLQYVFVVSGRSALPLSTAISACPSVYICMTPVSFTSCLPLVKLLTAVGCRLVRLPRCTSFAGAKATGRAPFSPAPARKNVKRAFWGIGTVQVSKHMYLDSYL